MRGCRTTHTAAQLIHDRQPDPQPNQLSSPTSTKPKPLERGSRSPGPFPVSLMTCAGSGGETRRIRTRIRTDGAAHLDGADGLGREGGHLHGIHTCTRRRRRRRRRRGLITSHRIAAAVGRSNLRSQPGRALCPAPPRRPPGPAARPCSRPEQPADRAVKVREQVGAMEGDPSGARP